LQSFLGGNSVSWAFLGRIWRSASLRRQPAVRDAEAIAGMNAWLWGAAEAGANAWLPFGEF